MHTITLSGLSIFPIKSLGGITLTEAAVERRGLRYDRRWMLVDANGDFLTQRDYPRMALIALSLVDDGLRCTAPGMPPLIVPFHLDAPRSIMVTVWRSTCAAHLVSATVDGWFSDFLRADCQLVYMPDTSERAVNPNHASDGDIVSFADGYPFLILGEASLADLNERLEQPVPMNRFRPNLVITGSPAFAEDDWRTIRIGAVTFHIVKPCARCMLTTVDQAIGKVSGKEPLRTLARYRTVDQQVLFGQNAIGPGDGTVRVGDVIEVMTSAGSDGTEQVQEQ